MQILPRRLATNLARTTERDDADAHVFSAIRYRRLNAVGALGGVAAAATIIALAGRAVLSSPPATRALAAAAPATRVCTRFASPAGNDAATGTRQRPFATADRLARALRPGQTGCLLPGSYHGDVRVLRGGADGAPITLRSAPGGTATLVGRVYVADSADWVTIARLHLDGRNPHSLPSPTVDGDHVTFAYDDVTNGRMGGGRDGDGICFDVGDPTGHYGYAYYTTITRSTIHDCGFANRHDHGVYLAGSYYARIVGNWIWDNPDDAIELYPDAHHTLVANNIIADNGTGVVFSGDEKHASSDNLVEHNVIVGSRLRYNVEYWWGGTPGRGNIVRENCLYGGAYGNMLEPRVGYRAISNRIVYPTFIAATQPTEILPSTACAAYSPPATHPTR